jgi:5'-nucleotidase
MNRRKFIQQGMVAGSAMVAGSLLPEQLLAVDNPYQLTILHTNDVHSRLDPFPMDGGRNQGMGGVAARAALIQKIRQEQSQVLLLDAGDIFQGTPYFNIYKGEPEIKAMTMMGYDACTMGNHDFDGGIENFATQLEHANFSVLMANYDFTGTISAE